MALVCGFQVAHFISFYEQVEEEENVGDLIRKIELVKDAGLYLLDQEVAKRTFVAPVE